MSELNNEIKETTSQKLEEVKPNPQEVKEADKEKGVDGKPIPQEIKNVSDVKTSIDDKVTEVKKQELPDEIKKSFQDREYKTVTTDEPVTIYRVYGGKADADGSFATTEKPFDALSSKMDSALKPEWGNSKMNYEEITIPEGTEINIGKVEKQYTPNGQELSGGADQVLLPQDWSERGWETSEHKLEARPFAELVQAEKDIHESNK